MPIIIFILWITVIVDLWVTLVVLDVDFCYKIKKYSIYAIKNNMFSYVKNDCNSTLKYFPHASS